MLSGRARAAGPWGALLGALTLVACVATEVLATPFMPEPVGPRAIGRAGAVTASADDLWALAVTPAGLIHDRGGGGLELGASLGLHATRLSYARVGVDPQLRFPLAESRTGTTSLPSFGVRLGLLGGRLAFGAARFIASREELGYPRSPATTPRAIDDPQRYLVRALTSERTVWALGMAARPLCWLALGASFSISQLSFDFGRDGWVGTSGDLARSEDPRLDLPTQVALADDVVPALGLGLKLRPPHSRLGLALSLELPWDADLSGRASLGATRGAPAGFRSVHAEGLGTVRLARALPIVARTGVRLAGARADLELDAELAHLPSTDTWSATATDLRLVAVDFAGQNTVTEITSVPLALATRTRYRIALGSDLVLVPGFMILRLGWALTSASAPAALRTAASAQGRTQALALGLAVHSAGLRLEVGWQHTLVTRTATRTSAWRHWNPLAEGNTEDVGSGDYSSAEDLVGVGLSIDVGAARRAFAPPPEPALEE